MRFWVLIFLLLGELSVYAQINIPRAIIVDGDTIPEIDLPTFVYHGRLTVEERRERLLLIARVRHVMPYAKMTAFRLQMLEENLKQISSKKARKTFIKKTEKTLKEEFSNQLKNLSIEEGKVLVKLISRESGSTVYDLLDNYTGTAEKFFWSTFSSFYDYELDTAYDPVEDYKIEIIIKQFKLE
jgi:hypothetical protein